MFLSAILEGLGQQLHSIPDKESVSDFHRSGAYDALSAPIINCSQIKLQTELLHGAAGRRRNQRAEQKFAALAQQWQKIQQWLKLELVPIPTSSARAQSAARSGQSPAAVQAMTSGSCSIFPRQSFLELCKAEVMLFSLPDPQILDIPRGWGQGGTKPCDVFGSQPDPIAAPLVGRAVRSHGNGQLFLLCTTWSCI